jgi:hypothetical protein
VEAQRGQQAWHAVGSRQLKNPVGLAVHLTSPDLWSGQPRCQPSRPSNDSEPEPAVQVKPVVVKNA